MPKQSLSLKIYFDPVYTEIVRAVGWRGLPKAEVSNAVQSLLLKFDKTKLGAASAELTECDAEGTIFRLKEEVQRLCRGLLGPKPEEWDDFYSTVYNPPPNPYTTKVTEVPPNIDSSPSRTDSIEPAKGSHESSEKREPAKSPGKFDGHSAASIEPRNQGPSEPRRLTPPPEMTIDEMLRTIDDGSLEDHIAACRLGLDRHGPRTRLGRELRSELGSAEAELRRRNGISESAAPSVADEIETIRATHGRDLRRLLFLEHARLDDSPENLLIRSETLRRIDLLEAEMRKRRQKIPERPAVGVTEPDLN